MLFLYDDFVGFIIQRKAGDFIYLCRFGNAYFGVKWRRCDLEGRIRHMDRRTKWTYCIGATGRDAAYALVSMFLMLYVQYTMNLTTAQFAVISAIMVLCMVWDAINDLLMGIIIENTNMAMGKFKPWILIGAITNALCIVALFSIRPTGWGFVCFYSIAYLCWGMTYTMNDIAYWGVLPTLTSDARQRDNLVTIMGVFICVGQFLVGGIVPIVVAGNAVVTYRVIAMIVAVSLVLFQGLTAFGITENDRLPKQKQLSLKDMFAIFARNDQLVCMGIANLLFNVGCNLLIIFGVNFFYIEYGYSDAGDLVTLFTVMYGLGTLVSQALYATIANRFTRLQILKVVIVVLVVGYLSLLGFGYVLPKNLILLNAVGFVIFFAQGLFNLVNIVMINNTIEYDEVRFQERHDSVISAVRSFSVKLAGGINQGISTLTLIVSGIYVMSQNISALEIQVGQGSTTTEKALEQANGYISMVTGSQALIFRLCMVCVPLVTLVASYVLIRKRYRIDENEYASLLAKLGR